MIHSFADKEAERIFQRQRSKKISSRVQKIVYRKLLMIHAATQLEDLRVPPGNHLKKLKGKRKQEHSIRINDQWRICFVWKNGNVYDVTIEDYH